MKRFLMTLFIGILASGLCYGAQKKKLPGAKNARVARKSAAASEIDASNLCEPIANGQAATGENLHSSGPLTGEEKPMSVPIFNNVKSVEPGNAPPQ